MVRGLPRSLRMRLLFVMAVALLPLALALVLNGLAQRRAAAELAVTGLRHAVVDAGNHHSDQIADARRILTVVSALPAVRGDIRERCDRALASVLNTTPQFQNISLLSTAGRPLCSALPLPSSTTTADRPYFQQALASGEFTVSSVVASRVTGLPAIATALPIRDDRAQISAVLVAGFDLHWFEDTLQTTMLPPGSQISLLDSSGRMLARAPAEPAALDLDANPQLRAEILASSTAGSARTIATDGSELLVSYAPIGTGQPVPLHVVVTTPASAVYDSADRVFLHSLAAFALFLILAAVLLTAGLSRLILAPVASITTAARRIAAGERTARSGLGTRSDEIGALGAAFDQMADTLETQARELEERSRIAETHARLLERSQTVAQVGGWEINFQTGLVFWTAEVYRILEIPFDEPPPHLDQTLSFYTAESRTQIEQAIEHARQTGEGWDLELELVTRSGRLRQVRVLGTIQASGGVPVIAYGAVQDISNHKEREARLHMALSAGQMGIWVFDIPNAQIFWSEETERIFGLAAGSFDGRLDSYFRYTHPDDLPQVQSQIETMLDSTRDISVYHSEHRIIRPDGSVHWIQADGMLERHANGSPHTLRGVVTDITDRKAAEAEQRRLEFQMQQTQKLESLGVLAGGIAHDFNNLLVSVIGYADLGLLDLDDDDPMRANFEAIIQSAQNAAELCRQLLAYAGKGHLNPRAIQLSDLVSEMMSLIQVSISKKAQLQLKLADDLPLIEAEPGQLRQIVLNLIINASEAIGDNEGQIIVSTGVMECDRHYLQSTQLASNLPPGTYIFLDVSDTGKGMDEATRQRIFDPFFSTKMHGRGLGLAAVLGIVTSHHAAIRVDSTPGKGTCFRVLFPPAALSDRVAPALPIDRSAVRLNGTVLLIDDEESVRNVLSRMLQSMELNLISASDGMAGIAVYEQHASDIALVLLDMTMPRMDGAETFYELRRRNLDLPIILMSGYNDQGRTVDPAGRGPDGFLAKPFREQELLGVLQTVTDGERVRS